MSVHPQTEASLVNLNDDELKDFVSYLWEAITTLQETMKNDSELQRLQDAVRTYRAEHYKGEIVALNVKLKAARAQVKIRGLRFRLPEAMK